MSGITRTTTDHETIRKWVQARGGEPAHVRPTADDGDPGVMRIAFPDHEDRARLETIEWDRFFATLDEKNLAFVYQEATSDGDVSRFCRLVSR